jgi:hypothetical protein
VDAAFMSFGRVGYQPVGMTCGTIASLRIAAPSIRGAAIRDPGRRLVRRISGHISPAGTGSGGRADHRLAKHR